MDSQETCKDLIESTEQKIKKISLNNEAGQGLESVEISISKKRTRNSSQASHNMTLPHPSQPLGGHPLFMPGAQMTLPHMNFPFTALPNGMQFPGFLGPLHPISPPPFSNMMHFNGPLSAPNLVNPSQLLFQYGSPFPNSHPRHGQR